MKSLSLLFLLVIGATLPASYSFAKDPEYTFRLAMTWGADFPLFADSPKRVAAMVDAMSNGRLKIEIVGAQEHGKPLGIIDMVRSGEYDMGHSASHYWKNKYPNTLFFTTSTFGVHFTQ